MTPIMRMRQGLRAMFAFARPLDETVALRWLTSDELTLFRRLQRGERLHAINVLRAVAAKSGAVADDDPPPVLAAAALLHDIGKVRYPMRLWQKTAVVLVRRFLPAWYARWAAMTDADHPGWQRPFIVYVQHPAWAADYLTPLNTDPRTIWLCIHHASPPAQWHDHPLYPLLTRLQAADDAN